MVSYRVFLVAVVVLTALTCVVQAVEGETKKKKEREKGKERGEKNRKDRNRRVRRLERRVAGIEGELLQHVTALRAGIGEQKERMQEVEALLNLHGDDVSSLRETLVKLQQVHDQIWRSLATLEKGAQDQTNVANERWEAHHRQTARVDSYLEGLETKQEEFVSLFQARCDAQDKRLDGLDVYIREAGGGGGGSDGESGDLYARLVMLEAAIDGLIVQFHQHVQDGPEGARSTGVTSSTGGNVVTNAQVEGAVAVLQDENAALKSTIDQQQRKLDKLEEHVSKLYRMFDGCHCEDANTGQSETESNSIGDTPVTPSTGTIRPDNHLSTQGKEGVQQDESGAEGDTAEQPLTQGTQDVELTTRPTPVKVTTTSKPSTTTESYKPQAQFALDCADLYHNGERSDGIHSITARLGRERRPMDVFCDMTTAGGGWTVIQRRLDGSVLFNRTWHQYKRRFGKIRGEYWLGLDNMYFLTNQRNYTLRIDLEDWEGNSAWARYDIFRVGGEWTYYQLSIGNYSGTAGDGFQGHNGAKFSTIDQDNDETDYHNCAALRGDGWWHCGCTPRWTPVFGSCSMDSFECGGAFINGKYLGNCRNREDWRAEFYGQTCCGLDDCCGWLEGVVWYKWKKVVSLKSVSMKIRPRDFKRELELP
ncbi:angiopoietin-related protein 3-like [Branchiostoma floridae]|uniref:Angiopoietin-related protein 3-like n=1 Tax=Branchiostoma floridae TaxID=7739 RepID=A0A9J7L8L7_BRAFL|nr:angiopoietin-related protein 3-like [Branchiostoma floridae]